MIAPAVSSEPEQRPAYASLLYSACGFFRAFVVYAGRGGVVAAVLVALGALVEGLGFVLLIPLLGVVFGTGAIGSALQHRIDAVFHAVGAQSAFARLVVIFAFFVLVIIVRGAVTTLRNVKLAELEIGFVNSKQLRIMQRLAAANWDRLVHLRHARVTHVIGGDIERIGTASHFMLQGIIACTMLAVQCALAFVLAPVLSLLVIVLLVIGGVALMPMLRRSRELGEYLTDANLALLDETAQFLGGLKLAISQDLQSRFVSKFQTILQVQSRRQIDYIRQHTMSQLSLTAFSAVVAAVLVLMGFSIFHIAPAILMTLVAIIARMNGPAGQIQIGAQQLAHALPAYEKIIGLEAELMAAESARTGMNADILPEGPIVFENVSFVHTGTKTDSGPKRGVSGFYLTIGPGEFLGIAGPTGSGKTTFADLLVGLFAPQSGLITIGGVPLDARLLPQWRKTLSYVSQDPFLFHETVRGNLTWASPQASDREIWEALRLTGAEALVRRMKMGLDTVVGERGALVSGGERQRIALAAAILRKPRLLVLDEATSAIDIASERVILANLRALRPRPTIIIIAHRAESLERCERVVRFEAGHADLNVGAEFTN